MSVDLIKSCSDARPCAYHAVHFESGLTADRVSRHDVCGIGHGDGQGVPDLEQWHELVGACERFAHKRDNLRIGAVGLEVHVRQAEEFGVAERRVAL